MQNKPYAVTFAARAPKRAAFDPAAEAAMDAAVYAMRLDMQTTTRRTDGSRSAQVGSWTAALVAQFVPLEIAERAA